MERNHNIMILVALISLVVLAECEFQCDGSSPNRTVIEYEYGIGVAMTHIFCGEINSRGRRPRATGFHVIPPGVHVTNTPTNVTTPFAQMLNLSYVLGRHWPVSIGVNISDGQGGWVIKPKSRRVDFFDYFPIGLTYTHIVNLLRGAISCCKMRKYRTAISYALDIKGSVTSSNIAPFVFKIYFNEDPNGLVIINTAFVYRPQQNTNLCNFDCDDPNRPFCVRAPAVQRSRSLSRSRTRSRKRTRTLSDPGPGLTVCT